LARGEPGSVGWKVGQKTPQSKEGILPLWPARSTVDCCGGAGRYRPKRARQQVWRNPRRGQASSGRRRQGSPGRGSVARQSQAQWWRPEQRDPPRVQESVASSAATSSRNSTPRASRRLIPPVLSASAAPEPRLERLRRLPPDADQRAAGPLRGVAEPWAAGHFSRLLLWAMALLERAAGPQPMGPQVLPAGPQPVGPLDRAARPLPSDRAGAARPAAQAAEA
jgi:hypothetical protein